MANQKISLADLQKLGIEITDLPVPETPAKTKPAKSKEIITKHTNSSLVLVDKFVDKQGRTHKGVGIAKKVDTAKYQGIAKAIWFYPEKNDLAVLEAAAKEIKALMK